MCARVLLHDTLPVCACLYCAVQVPDSPGKYFCKPHLIYNIIGKNDILPFFHLLRFILVTYVLHTAWIAGAEVWLVEIPGSLVLVLDTEGLDFEANNAGEISFNISMIQYREPQVIVQGKLAIILHAINE